MPFSLSPDVEQRISDLLATGRYADANDVVREALKELEVDEEFADLEAVQEGLEAMRAGDPGMPVDEAFAEIRRAVENKVR